jgi:hypothetical protein
MDEVTDCLSKVTQDLLTAEEFEVHRTSLQVINIGAI